MRFGRGSLPVTMENTPSVTLRRLTSAATEMSDNVITCIPGSSDGTATAYPQLPTPTQLSLDGHMPMNGR